MTGSWVTDTGRIRALLTGQIRWVDENGTAEVEKLGWRDRWSVFGSHSWSWWWVRRFGQMRCGCTRNPLTRRLVLIAMDCPVHCGLDWQEDR